MLISKEVIDGLNGIECRYGHFDEDRVPAAHGSVPEARQFERQQFLTVLGLMGDEAGRFIDEVEKVKAVALVVLECADEIDGIEVGRFGHQSRIGYLRGLEDLVGDGAVGFANKEGTSAGFAGVFHHTADTNRTIEATTLFVGEVRVLQGLEDALLFRHQHTGQDLFVANRIFLETVGHDIVDILDEDDIGVLVIEVMNEGTVSARAKEQFAVRSAEGCSVGIGSQGIGGGQLLGESDVIVHAVFLLKALQVIGYMLSKERQMVVRDGEVQVHDTLGSGIESTFNEVFEGRRAGTVSVSMEEQQTLGQGTVVHIFEQVTNGRLTLFAFELGTERKLILVRQKLRDEGCLDTVVEVLEQVLEHTRSGTAGRNEFLYRVSLIEVLLPESDEMLLLLFRGLENTFLERRGSRSYDV